MLLSMKHCKLQKGLRKKLAPRYIGPFEIADVIGPKHLSYRLKLPMALQRMHPVFHVSTLKEYKSTGNYQPPPLPDIIDDEPEWTVELIDSTRYEGSRRQYRVCWAGGDLTWEKEQNLTHCPGLIKKFWESKDMECPHPIRGEHSESEGELSEKEE